MDDLIEANMGLVVSVVNLFSPKSDEERDEYIQAGRIGLWKALQKYDPDRGCKFSPYARNPIRWEIIKAINAYKKYNNHLEPNDLIVGYLETNNDSDFWEYIPDDMFTDEEKQVIYLRLSNYNFTEICKKIGRGRHYTKKLFMSAVEKLRETNE
jgi:RNA polymerase sigma factor (sigma-70 family)